MKKEKAQIIKKVKETAGGKHSWYEAYLPKEKRTAIIRKPNQ